MPVLLQRDDGTLSPLKNAEYLPAFFLIPEGIRKKCGKELDAIPREVIRLRKDKSAHKLIESNLFRLAIIDAYAYMVWPFITPDTIKMEIYSGYDPIWKIAHIPDIWINEMTLCGTLPSVEQLFKSPPDYTFPNVPGEQVYMILSYIVPRAMMRHGLWDVVRTVTENRCFEDYDSRDSFQKTDFYRQWYHTRTKHPQISYEKFRDDWQEMHDGRDWDLEDPSVKTPDEIASEIDIEAFISGLSEKDRQILQLRRAGRTYEDIAKAAGFKTHSAVGKRLKKIGREYEAFAGIKNPGTWSRGLLPGTPSGVRTLDTLIKSQVLCQLS